MTAFNELIAELKTLLEDDGSSTTPCCAACGTPAVSPGPCGGCPPPGPSAVVPMKAIGSFPAWWPTMGKVKAGVKTQGKKKRKKSKAK